MRPSDGVHLTRPRATQGRNRNGLTAVTTESLPVLYTRGIPMFRVFRRANPLAQSGHCLNVNIVYDSLLRETQLRLLRPAFEGERITPNKGVRTNAILAPHVIAFTNLAPPILPEVVQLCLISSIQS
jgi:hypothetical protein